LTETEQLTLRETAQQHIQVSRTSGYDSVNSQRIESSAEGHQRRCRRFIPIPVILSLWADFLPYFLAAVRGPKTA